MATYRKEPHIHVTVNGLDISKWIREMTVDITASAGMHIMARFRLEAVMPYYVIEEPYPLSRELDDPDIVDGTARVRPIEPPALPALTDGADHGV